jgi:hypothetical protein
MAKPPKTKVKIYKQGEQLTLIVPRKQQLSKEAVHQVLITSAIDILAIALMIANIWMIILLRQKIAEGDGGSIAGLCVGLLFLGPLCLWVLGAAFKNTAEMCKQVLSDTSVSIDNKHLALSTQFKRFDWGTLRRIKVKDILGIVVTDYKYVEGVHTKKAPCFLVLQLDQGTMNLFTAEHSLSRSEAKWLGKELSRWMDVELMVE